MTINMTKIGLVCALLAGAALASTPAAAQWRHHHGPRVGIGLHFGVPFPGYYYPPPVYYPRVVVAAPPAPVYYVERPPEVQLAPAPAPAAPAGDWFYCSESNGYYPYVRECPGGWQRVPATPPR